jgi:hypothetical protein
MPPPNGVDTPVNPRPLVNIVTHWLTKKRKFEVITSPENISDFIASLRKALKDPVVQNSFQLIFKSAVTNETKKLHEKVSILERRLNTQERTLTRS